jgi:hypothetical protein
MRKKSPLIVLFEWFGPVLMFALAIVNAGLALSVACYFFNLLLPMVASATGFLVFITKGLLYATCYYIYGFSLILIIPFFAFILRAYPQPYRGPAVAFVVMKWYTHSVLTFLARFTFLEFITPTMFSQLFYRLMGMKIGKNVYLNSTRIVDPCLLELGDNVTIGGSASIMAHYAQAGYLILSPVKIGAGATVGLRATIMGGVEMGEKSKVLANSFVLPNSKIPPGETWGGIPAAKLDLAAIRGREAIS